MMGTWGATWLVCLLFLFIGVVGIGFGCIASLITRKTLAIRVALVDGATAIAVAILYAAIVSKIQIARGNFQDISGRTVTVGAGSVILKHALVAAFRSRHQA